jgi:hypothetical protein
MLVEGEQFVEGFGAVVYVYVGVHGHGVGAVDDGVTGDGIKLLELFEVVEELPAILEVGWAEMDDFL